MPHVQVSIADVSEHATLNRYYLQWGYQGGIADTDVVFVARVDSQPAGIVRRARESGVLMLRGMYVAPEQQRRGLGTRLLEAFVADVPPIECFCVPFAHLTAFYGQAGFSVIDESHAPEFLRQRLVGYRTEGRAVLVMRRDAGNISIVPATER